MPRKGYYGSIGPAVTVPVYRPPPPENFSDAEKEIWDGAIEGMRDSWFSPATLPLLRGYCVIVARADAIADELRGLPVNSPEARTLSAEHRDLMKSVALLATRIRVAPSSNKSTKDGMRRSTGYPKPWEDWGHDDHADAS